LGVTNSGRLRDFIASFSNLMEFGRDENLIVEHGRPMLKELVRFDDWLPADYSLADPHRYRQYLLYCDGLERFSVVTFVWAPGQSTPIHNHTVWGMIGILRGGEICQSYRQVADGKLHALGDPRRLSPGDVDVVSPLRGDIHKVRNAYDDRDSISIHVYGGNIGAIRRFTFDNDGRSEPFVSGYSNDVVPTI